MFSLFLSAVVVWNDSCWISATAWILHTKKLKCVSVKKSLSNCTSLLETHSEQSHSTLSSSWARYLTWLYELGIGSSSEYCSRGFSTWKSRGFTASFVL